MEVHPVVLVLADISGYTRLLTQKSMSLEHAEAIITDLLESVLDSATHPLVLNKLEGDAAFLFARFEPGQEEQAAKEALRQVAKFREEFERRRAELITNSICRCDGCGSTHQLRLKSFVHLGKALFKRVRQFDELAGEDVILIHRLLKNSVPSKEYILATRPIHSVGGGVPAGYVVAEHRELLEGLGEVDCRVYYPEGLAPATTPAPTFWGKARVFGLIHRPMLAKMFGLKATERG